MQYISTLMCIRKYGKTLVDGTARKNAYTVEYNTKVNIHIIEPINNNDTFILRCKYVICA